MISQIDASQFDDQVKASPVPVLVEFFTEYCTPCQQMLLVLADIAAERADALRVLKFNAAADPVFASSFRIFSAPNFILFQEGIPVGQRSGAMHKRDLLAWIDSTIAQR